MPEAQVKIRLPYAEQIHGVINAHLRTSERAVWEADGRSEDGFTMAYHCGGRQLSAFGLKLPLSDPKFIEFDLFDECPAKLPVRLTITIRPSPQTIVLTLAFACPPVYPYPTSRYRDWVQKAKKAIDGWLAQIASAESSELADYLQEFYCLAERPEVTLRIDGDAK